MEVSLYLDCVWLGLPVRKNKRMSLAIWLGMMRWNCVLVVVNELGTNERACPGYQLLCVRTVLTDDLFVLVITDPEDPRFDLDKLVKKWEAEAL